MKRSAYVAAWVGGLLLTPVVSLGVCPPSCPLPGGGTAKQDCHAEFASTAMRLNYPAFNPAKPKPGKEVRCFDGDAGCDLDGTVNNQCVFDVDVCLHNADPAIASCTPADVTAVTVASASKDPDLAALQTAVNALLPATANTCTAGQGLHVSLQGPDSSGQFKRTSKTVSLKARTASGSDSDKLKLTCVPHEWPSHGYNPANLRATPLETALSSANAATITRKWQLDLKAREGGGANGVTSTPTVGDGLVYVTSWNGKVYALVAKTGKVKWQYDTGSGTVLGLQSSATLTADGRVLVGDSDAKVYCLDATKGTLLWKTDLLRDHSCSNAIMTPCTTDADCGTGNTCRGIDHIWDSPTVANNRVFVGIASHSDQPCTHGRLVALDLDTGTELWTRTTVPDKVCTNNTSIACSTNADCGPGTCVTARGAGVTATVAVDPTGETVYMNTVGCYTFPSVGDSDSIFKLDAATGTPAWIRRVQPPEQFGAAIYHDFGFLNGPLLVNADDGMGGTRPLVVSGSKDGTLYALNPSDGTIVWKNVVRPTPVTPNFAGFGLFNGALGFADQRFYATLNDFGQPLNPAPNHLMAFSAVDGNVTWQDDIGASWGSMAVANGLLFMGTLATQQLCSNNPVVSCSSDGDCSGGTCQNMSFYYVYDASNGTRLKTFTMPDNVSSGASVVNGTIYVGYGIFGSAGGVQAFSLP